MQMQKMFVVREAESGTPNVEELSPEQLQTGVKSFLYIGTKYGCNEYLRGNRQKMGLYGVKYSEPHDMLFKSNVLAIEIQKGQMERYLYVGSRPKCNEFMKERNYRWYLMPGHEEGGHGN